MIDNFERYTKNLNPFTRGEVEAAHAKSVCIAGCGGLGGYVASSLARFGVGKLTLVDGDVFAPSNLNRQLFCTEENLGESKAVEAKNALSKINSSTDVRAITEFIDVDNCADIVSGHDLVMDCLDNVPSRIALEDGCKSAGIPLIHGAISGFSGQVACIFPGDGTLRKLYEGRGLKTHDKAMGNPPFTPQLVAAIQCCEAIKMLTGRGSELGRKLLVIDMNFLELQTVEIV